LAFDELIQNEKSHGHINHGTIWVVQHIKWRIC
jgi:hypothetical protein